SAFVKRGEQHSRNKSSGNSAGRNCSADFREVNQRQQGGNRNHEQSIADQGSHLRFNGSASKPLKSQSQQSHRQKKSSVAQKLERPLPHQKTKGPKPVLNPHGRTGRNNKPTNPWGKRKKRARNQQAQNNA